MKQLIWIPFTQTLGSGAFTSCFVRPFDVTSFWDNGSGGSNINFKDGTGLNTNIPVASVLNELQGTLPIIALSFISGTSMVANRTVYINSKNVSSIFDNDGSVSGAASNVNGVASPAGSTLTVSETPAQVAQFIQQALLNEK